MSYGLFDTVGVPLTGWDEVTDFVLRHRHEVAWHRTCDENWLAGQWTDPSGVMITAAVGTAGHVQAVPGFLGAALTAAAGFGVVDGENMVFADVVDAEGERITRFCAGSGQASELHLVPEDRPAPVVLTGLVAHVGIHADEKAFFDSPDSSMGPLKEPRELPDGSVMSERRVALPSFFPTGMLKAPPWTPMALVNAFVEGAWTATVAATGERVVVVRVHPLDGFGMYLCWPEALAPRPEVGNVVHAHAYLTAYLPDIWQQLVARNPRPVDLDVDIADRQLDPLTVGGAYVLRALFQDALDAAGLDWTYDGGDYYELADGVRLGLGGLAVLLAEAEPDDWAGIVDERVANIVAMIASRDDEVTRDQIYPRLRRAGTGVASNEDTDSGDTGGSARDGNTDSGNRGTRTAGRRAAGTQAAGIQAAAEPVGARTVRRTR